MKPPASKAPAVRLVSVDILREQPGNPRGHSDKQVALLAAGIRRYGFTLPILIEMNGKIVAGHARARAARSIGMTRIPAITATGWSAREIKAYIIADNRLAEMSEWDGGALGAELTALQGMGAEIPALGFTDADLTALNAVGAGQSPADEENGEESPDDCADGGGESGEAASERQIKPGQTIELDGGHRIIVAGGAKGADRAAGAGVNVLVTEPPPRGIDWRGFDGGAAYLWGRGHADTARNAAAIHEAGMEPRYQVVWLADSAPQSGKGVFAPEPRTALLAGRAGMPGAWNGGRKQSTAWTPLFGDDEADSAAPVEARRRCIVNHTERDGAVFDPHGDDGLTLHAARADQRRAVVVASTPAKAKTLLTKWRQSQ